MALPVRSNRRETTLSEKLVAAGIGVAGTLLLLVALVIWLDPANAANLVGSPATAREDLALVDTGCQSNVMLATAGRVSLCMSPLRGGDSVEACVDDAMMTMWMDLSGCEARQLPDRPVAMAMIDTPQIEKLKPIDPEPLLEELRQDKQQQPPPPPPPQIAQQPPPPPPPPPAPKRPQQVVETVKPDSEQAPDNARLLSEHDVKVNKQTVARGARNEPMVAKSKPEELKATREPVPDPSSAKPPDKPPGQNDRAPEVPGTLSMRKPGSPSPNKAPQVATIRGDQQGARGPVVSDGFIPRRGDGAVEQQRRDPGELTPGQGGAGGGSPQVPNLRPTKEQLERIVGGGSVDHLDDVEEGDETALNSKRWIYASFFNRLKRQVAQNWDPVSVWRRIDPDGTKNGFKTRVTEVRVTLTRRGQLDKVVILSPSGVNDLDAEALRAFHAAGPFPNPPDGLVNKSGMITFAFSFYFEIGQSRTAWRVIRN